MQYSTFFPEGWNVERIKEEIAFAFKNKSPKEGSSTIFRGYSTDNLEIWFVMINNDIRTVYPIRKIK
ncbi:MAG: EndoU domain-containing protein [Chitinophagales bacterium]|nr:EndoU domain-containing protein [Chitinophagales bacterium]